MTSLIHTSVHEGIARIRLNRADKRNALTRSMLQELHHATKSIAASKKARVCIIEAEGSVFCAGMDLGEMQARASSTDAEAEWQMDSEIYCDLLGEIYALDIPTIAAVQGAAVAGGVGIVLACDLILVSRSAYFALPEPVRGITAAMVTPLLLQRVGCGAARQLLLSLERCSAERAMHLGLANDAVADDQLQTRVSEVVASILSGSRLALALTKQHLAACTGKDMREQLRRSAVVSATARQSVDAREGLQAFLEKRKPSWSSI